MKTALYIAVFVAISFSPYKISAENKNYDSLKTALSNTTNSNDRIDVLLNLKDLAETDSEEMQIALELYEEAIKESDKLATISAISSISAYYIGEGNIDSLFYYLNNAKDILKDSDGEGLYEYYLMTLDARKLQTTDRDKRESICDSLLNILESGKDNETKYQRAKRLFLTGVITYQLMSISGESSSITAGLPFWEEEWELIQDFPAVTRRNFAANAITCLLPAYIDTKNKNKIEEVSNRYFNILDTYFANPEILTRRPYISKDAPYIICYHSLIGAFNEIGKEKAHEYYLRFRRFINSNSTSILKNKNFYYTISCTHYENMGDYKTALKYSDSMIMLQRTGQSIITSHTQQYKKRAELLRRLGRYSEACKDYESYIHENDSLMQKNHADRVRELQVQYEVDKLELERTNILSEKRRNNLYFSIALCILTIIIAIYFYYSLQKERQLKKELEKQQHMAQESEKFKREFINSISHEIRTPLNAICGFSSLVANDDDMATDERSSYVKIIEDNSKGLTDLIDSMLEVALLDSTEQALPVEDTDITAIFKDRVEEAKNYGADKNINYYIEPDYKPCFIKTNEKYISKVVKELLANATKFTDNGEIKLEYEIETGSKTLIFSVVDTGRGISEEHAETVFERFFKEDSFTKGNGLGLSMCRLIVNKLGGRIYVDTSYKQGAKLTIRIAI